jgi:hypothetical protein
MQTNFQDSYVLFRRISVFLSLHKFSHRSPVHSALVQPDVEIYTAIKGEMERMCLIILSNAKTFTFRLVTQEAPYAVSIRATVHPRFLHESTKHYCRETHDIACL